MRCRFLAVILTLAAFLGSLGSVYATEAETQTEPIVVDVSQGSVQAIADAVTADDGSMYLTLNDGSELELCSYAADYWPNYDYKLVVRSSTNYHRIYFWNDDYTITWNSDDTKFCISGYPVILNETNALTATTTNWFPVSSTDIVWCNKTLIGANTGVLVYEADTMNIEEQAFLVSFETGFEDLVVESQYSNSDSFSVPNLIYSGYSFCGWYLDEDCTTPYTASYTFTSDTTLYAKWVEAGTMAFFGGSLLESFTVMFEAEPILWCVSLIALVVIVGIIRSFFISRM